MAGQVIERDRLGALTKIGQGGQGVVYGAPNVKIKFASSMVYKEYKPQTRAEIDFTALAAMPALVEQSLSYAQAEQLVSIAAWPCAMVEEAGTPTGFVMPAIPQEFFLALTTAKGSSSSAGEFQHLLNHPSVLAARGITIDEAQRYSLLRETASGLAFLHKHGVCVGDISPKNLLFSLAPHPAVYFIDCDAMRINGVSVLRQVETPGWQVPAGEELATVYSDTYKLGLLALRLLVGDHDTTNPAHLPSTTPDMLRQVITDTLTNAPQRRPLPEAWNYVLGNAIESAQHRQKTATRTPVSAAPAAPPTPQVYSRPSTSTPQSTPPPPPPTPQIRSRPSPPPPQSTPPPPPETAPVAERSPVYEEFPAAFQHLPPSAPSPQAGKRPTTALLIGAIVVLAVALALAIGIPALNKHRPSAAPVAQPSTTSTTTAPTTPPPVAEGALDGLLLSPDQINSAMGATAMAVFDYGPSNAMWQMNSHVGDTACLPVFIPREASAYAGSGSGALRSQALGDDAGDYWTNHSQPGHYIFHTVTHETEQAVVLFSSAQDANNFFTASAQRWPACANRPFIYTQEGYPDQEWTVGPVSNANGTLSATETLGGNWLWESCQRALTVANNVAIDVETCSKNQSDSQSDSAVNIAHQIAAKVPTT
jgi:eukaryotic-like serine/threonine-protein kinase